MNFVKTSDCIYIRNKSKHTGAEAVEHIQNKYDYFEDDITTAETFIELSASKSTISGKAYLIDCPNGFQGTSQKWLLDELQRFRATSKD